jgi:hypothetical protein
MVRSSGPGVRLGGQARVGCRSSLRRGRGGMMGCAVQTGRRGQSKRSDHATKGVMTCTTRTDQGESRGRCSWHPRQVSQGAHVTVAQRVEDELQLASGRGYGADVAAATVGNPLPQHPGHTSGWDVLDRLDRCPADQPGALLGDPAAVDMGIGLVMLGRQPRPARQLRRRGKPGDVADLGDEHRGQGGPDARDVLDRGVPRLLGHPAADHPGEQVDLELQVIDQPAQRGDPGRVRGGQVQPVQQFGAPQPEQVAHQHLHPALGQHGVDLGLAVRPQPDPRHRQP